MPRALIQRLALLSATLASGACVGAPPIVTASAVGCSQLIPGDWKIGVAPADLPTGETVGDWISFADAQTGRLDAANGRTKDAIEIVERCESRDAAAVKRAKKGWLARLIA